MVKHVQTEVCLDLEFKLESLVPGRVAASLVLDSALAFGRAACDDTVWVLRSISTSEEPSSPTLDRAFGEITCFPTESNVSGMSTPLCNSRLSLPGCRSMVKALLLDACVSSWCE